MIDLKIKVIMYLIIKPDWKIVIYKLNKTENILCIHSNDSIVWMAEAEKISKYQKFVPGVKK